MCAATPGQYQRRESKEAGVVLAANQPGDHMNTTSKAFLAATVLSFAIAAGAAPSQAQIFGGGGIKITGDIKQTVNANQVRTSGSAKVNAAIIKGNVQAKNVTQNVTLRNITATGSSEQNYAVIDGS